MRGVGLLAIVGLVVGVSACRSAAPASSADVAELHRQAQAALARWDAAAAKPGSTDSLGLRGAETTNQVPF